MHTTENLSARLREDLVAFIGTENWHRHPINRSMLLTDGVVYFADKRVPGGSSTSSPPKLCASIGRSPSW